MAVSCDGVLQDARGHHTTHPHILQAAGASCPRWLRPSPSNIASTVSTPNSVALLRLVFPLKNYVHQCFCYVVVDGDD